MNITSEYQEKKQNLLKAFELLSDYNFLPVKIGKEKIDKEAIVHHKENLINETFTVSVCGQINAGKSTLLNYLLFDGESILPADDTPWTAKLTTIKYGNQQSVKITFYSEEEWNNLKQQVIFDENSANETTYFEEYLQSEVVNSAKHGVYDVEFIKEISLIKEITNFNNLEEYVAKEGKYTPFVSHIELTTNNDLLKNVVIVDTPGINDSNILRSKVTEEWIGKSNAVIYLFYAGAALDIADFEFIDQYLLPYIPSGKIIFAINKADTNGEYKRAKEYVENILKNNEDLRERNLLKNCEAYPISSLAALLASKEEKSTLNENEQWYFDKFKKESNDFLLNKGYIENLTIAIENNIMQDKGFAILKKATQTIDSICKSKIKEVKNNIDENDTILNNVDLSVRELETKIEEIKKIRINIEGLTRKYEKKIGDFSTDLQNKIKSILDYVEKNIKEKYETWMYDRNITVDKAIKLTGYKLIEITKEIFIEKLDIIIPKEIEKELLDLLDHYKIEIKKTLNDDLQNLIDYFLVPPIDLNEISENAEKYFREELDLKKLREKAAFLWVRKTKSKDAFFEEVVKQVSEYIKNINNMIRQKLDNRINEFLEDTKDGVTRNLDSYQTKLDDLQNSQKNKETTKAESINKIDKFKEELYKLENNYRIIKENL